ncbi:MAG: DUF5916 domain-containing protein [Bacteroidota bacterium]
MSVFIHTFFSFVFLHLAGLTFTVSFSQSQPSQRILTAVRSQDRIRIDGFLTESVWDRKGEDGFVQREPYEGAPLSERTEVWIAYDDDALYVAARMEESRPDSIIGRLARRDSDPESDHIGFGIDAGHDRRTAYYFIVNPVGAIRDGTFSNDTYPDESWDGVWDVAVQVDEKGWTAEFRVPYSQLRFSKQDRYIWGIDFRRRIHRKNEEGFLVLHPRTDFLRVSRWPELHGIEGIEPPTRVEILPYVTATGKFLEKPPVANFNMGRDDPFILGRDFFGSAGADARIGLDGDLTLGLSLNPDFAQVEVDPAVVNLTAYEVRYQEKRPLFTEGSSILDNFGSGGAATLQNFNWTNPNFFYSRRIGRSPQGSVTHQGFRDIPDRTTILGAAKVTGRIDPTWSIAAVTALTDREFGRVDSAGVQFREEIEPLTLYTAFRTLKEFNGARQAIGVLGTFVERDLRESRLDAVLNRRAVSLAIDGWMFLDEEKDWVVTGWTGGTMVEGTTARIASLQRSAVHFFQRPDADHVEVDASGTTMTGWASRVWLDRVKGNLIFNAAVGAIHPKFDANDAGFLTNADVLNAHLYAGYQWFEQGGLFRYRALMGTIYRNYNFGGVATRSKYQVASDMQLVNFWRSYIQVGYDATVLDDQRTRGGPLMELPAGADGYLQVSSDPREALTGSITIQGSASSLRGTYHSFSLNLNWRASKTLQVQGGPTFFRLSSKAQYISSFSDPFAVETFGRRYVFGNLDQRQVAAALRVNWTFTPVLSFQLYLQPLLSIGSYSTIKEFAKPRTFSFNRYGEGASTIGLINDRYTVDPDGENGPANPFSFTNPNFNFKSVRANAVLRWEYLPGSTLYFVWTNEKVNYEIRGDFEWGRDVQTLLRDRPDNVFSVKLTYWLNP